MDTELVKTLLNIGGGYTILFLFGWFVYKKAWPWMTKHFDDVQKESQDNTKEFLKALERRDTAFDELVSELRRIKAIPFGSKGKK